MENVVILSFVWSVLNKEIKNGSRSRRRSSVLPRTVAVHNFPFQKQTTQAKPDWGPVGVADWAVSRHESAFRIRGEGAPA